LESLVRQKLDKYTGRIYKSEVDTITHLEIGFSCTEKTLSELTKLTNLHGLTIQFTNISDISAISKLTKLTELSLMGNQIRDLSVLSNLANLTHLSISNHLLRDLSALSNLPNLTCLSLEFNEISDISPLSNLTNLDYLYLNNNPINNKETPNAVHKSELDFKVGDTTYEVWVVEDPDEVLKGDLDGNGYFDSLDFALMGMYLVGKVKVLTERQMKAADVNSDGSINSLDFLCFDF